MCFHFSPSVAHAATRRILSAAKEPKHSQPHAMIPARARAHPNKTLICVRHKRIYTAPVACRIAWPFARARTLHEKKKNRNAKTRPHPARAFGAKLCVEQVFTSTPQSKQRVFEFALRARTHTVCVCVCGFARVRVWKSSVRPAIHKYRTHSLRCCDRANKAPCRTPRPIPVEHVFRF